MPLDILQVQDDERRMKVILSSLGMTAHLGRFSPGVDCLTMLLLGLTIKEAMFIFRGPNRLNP